MVIFKINGERNSGTNFLDLLLQKNGIKTHVDKKEKNIIYHWKHGVPDNSIKNIDERVIDIFIFRKLNSWLVSMFHTPYELKKKDDFKDFLTSPQEIIPTESLDFRTMDIFNKDDEGKTIFEIRYYKYNEIMNYVKNNKDVVLVNLEYIQTKSQCCHFLGKLIKKYNLNRTIYCVHIKKHTKRKKETRKNINYNLDTDKFQDIIDKYKNNEIENHINNLKFEMY